MKKTGLVLEGGAMRCMFTSGVLDVFLENGIRFDGACGISAGAVFGINYKSHQAGRAIRYSKKYASDPRFCSFKSLIKTGSLYGVDFCYREIPEVLDPFDKESFAKDPLKFYIGAMNVESGVVEYHECTDGGKEDMLWMQASASLPLASKPVEIGDEKYLDGGVIDSIPYEYMEKIGYNRNVMILTQHKGYRKKKDRTLPLIRIFVRKYPKVVKEMEVRHIRYNRQLEEVERRAASGEALIIRPPEPLGIKRSESDPEILEWIYQLGRSEALKRLDDVRAFLDAE